MSFPVLSLSFFLLTNLLLSPSVVAQNGQNRPVNALAAHRNAADKSDAIVSVAFSPDGRWLAAGGYRTVTLLNAQTGKIQAQWAGHAGRVNALAFRPDGKILAAAGGIPGRSGEIRLWDISRGKPLPTLTGHADVLHALAFSADGSQIVVGSYDKRVSRWQVPALPIL